MRDKVRKEIENNSFVDCGFIDNFCSEMRKQLMEFLFSIQTIHPKQ